MIGISLISLLIILMQNRYKKPGFDTQHDINLWSSDAKLKVRLHEQRITSFRHRSRTSNHNNEQDFQATNMTSLNRLRQKTREEQQNCTSLGNRLSYMQEQIRRKRRLVQQAKGRYDRIKEVRKQSVAEKKQLAQERLSQLKQHQASVNLKATRIRLDRRNSNITYSRWKTKNIESASEVKRTRAQNQHIITQQISEEVDRKRRKVIHGHQQTEATREKLKELSKRKEEQAKKQHDFKILQQFARSEMQRRKNGKLLAIFKQKAKKFEETKQCQSRELQQYEKLLGKCFKLGRSRSKDSFYLTR